MQVTCPECAQRIVLDDARVPDRPFSLKCPRCQNAIKLPGKNAAAAAGPASGAGRASEPPAPPAAAGRPSDESTPAPAAASGNEPTTLPLADRLDRSLDAQAGGRRALVVLPDRGQVAAAASTFTRLGFSVESLDDVEDGTRLLEQGLYSVVATNRLTSAPGKTESLYQRIARLSPDARRRIFLALVGEEFSTGDGAQAFAVLADAVLHPRDLAGCDRFLRNAIGDRARLYQVFLDALERHELSTG